MDLANLGFGPELQAIVEDDASQVGVDVDFVVVGFAKSCWRFRSMRQSQMIRETNGSCNNPVEFHLKLFLSHDSAFY